MVVRDFRHRAGELRRLAFGTGRPTARADAHRGAAPETAIRFRAIRSQPLPELAAVSGMRIQASVFPELRFRFPPQQGRIPV